MLSIHWNGINTKIGRAAAALLLCASAALSAGCVPHFPSVSRPGSAQDQGSQSESSDTADPSGQPEGENSNAAADDTQSGQAEAAVETDEDEYIDIAFYDEIKTYYEGGQEVKVSLSDEGYTSLMEVLNSEPSCFRYSEYYALDDALAHYNGTAVSKGSDGSLLTGGKLDADKLFQKVLENNSAVSVDGRNSLNAFYQDLEESEIEVLCDEIARVVNDRPVEFDMEEMSDTLSRLTIFMRSGTTSNAYISSELSFIYNPNGIGVYEAIQHATEGSSDTVWNQVIDHEVMHLIQHCANDGDSKNGLEIGFIRKYNDAEKIIPVDSLYIPWVMEAAAELSMAEYLGEEPYTYHNRISYVESYNLSRFYENRDKESALENISFDHSIDEAFAILGLDTEPEQREFLNYLFSIEITQSDPADFWEYYEAQTGAAPEEDEHLNIRMDIRADAVKYLTQCIFRNITDAVHDGALTDLNSVFYMLRLWEIDVFGHLDYTQAASLESAKEYIIWHDEMQNAFLTALAQSSGFEPEQVLNMYAEYYMQDQVDDENISENCSLDGLGTYMQDYIIANKQSITSTNHFSRIADVADAV